MQYNHQKTSKIASSTDWTDWLAARNSGLPETAKWINHWNYTNYGIKSLFVSFQLRHRLLLLSQQPRDNGWEQSELLWCLDRTLLLSHSGPNAAGNHIKTWVIYQKGAKRSPEWCACVSDCVAVRLPPLFVQEKPVIGVLGALSRQ